ncbi:hypothetical protein OGAPHI_003103 [Ogataea philodendri]|uniref:INO80 complex subunit B-like conserved region domain-containing protein n=1 Tax=Ogataea philodendri TaxID=1378263 RepID=A0A9P8PA16_9ASCO|nr:uncharacterized protein OGAPHI_003103 [Ogataea philodendri]KAH3667454.1 hypothetical protein OGAPHI_003103 [Ogataea philodendri]
MAKSDYESDELLDSEEDEFELESEEEYDEVVADEDDEDDEEEEVPKRRGRPLIEEAVAQDQPKRKRGAPKSYKEPGEDELPYSEDVDGSSVEDSTPSTDIVRMTERQRAKYTETGDDLSDRQGSGELLELTNDRSKKKQFTEEELQLRRLENARKRKNFTMKRLEMEKQDTLNKLLLKRADKVRNLKNLEGKEYGDEEDPTPTEAPRRPMLSHPALSRWNCRGVDQQVVSTYSFNE